MLMHSRARSMCRGLFRWQQQSMHLPDARLVGVLVGPHRLAALELAAVLQVEHAAAVAGVDDGVHPCALRQRVHQQHVQLIVHYLAALPQCSSGVSASHSTEQTCCAGEGIACRSQSSAEGLSQCVCCSSFVGQPYHWMGITLLHPKSTNQGGGLHAGSRRGRWSHSCHRPRRLTSLLSASHDLWQIALYACQQYLSRYSAPSMRGLQEHAECVCLA